MQISKQNPKFNQDKGQPTTADNIKFLNETLLRSPGYKVMQILQQLFDFCNDIKLAIRLKIYSTQKAVKAFYKSYRYGKL